MEKFIMADGCAIRIGDTGYPPPSPLIGVAPSARTVVLLHGYLENLNIWDDFAGRLQPYARIVAPDLPGHGISEVRGTIHTMDFLADVVYEALIGLEVTKYTVAGHSMGGYVALALAARHPEVLDGLILFSSTPNADSPEKLSEREREISTVESGKKEFLARTQPGKGFAPENRARLANEIEDLAELVTLTEDEGIAALLRGMAARHDINEMLGKLPPTIRQLFIFGRHDEYITPAVAAEMIARHPRAQTVWLEHSGHNGFIEEPRAAAEAMLDFMKIKHDDIK